MNQNDTIKKNLLAGHYITEDDAQNAEQFAATHHVPITEWLFLKGIITHDLLGKVTAQSFGVPYADLQTEPPSREQVLKIPEDIARKYRMILFQEKNDWIVIVTDNPYMEGMIQSISSLFPTYEVVLAYSFSQDIDTAFLHYQKTLQARFKEIIEREKRIAPEILEEIFTDAFIAHASDIHFEPQEKEVVVRFRIDGILEEAGRIPKDNYGNILNRIKIQAHLPIDQHFSAQDGAIRYPRKDSNVDLRISIVPTIDGEKVAIRLLTEYIKNHTLADLGLFPEQQKKIMISVKKPFGMVLVTGPTGSGKTTTLYTIIKMLNNPGVNITTIEDPIEYKVTGLNQIQVNAETNLTFTKGLRSIIRQDPNIILVGEIRDQDTAEIAVNAALTGHMLLSSFHANDASTAIPRLLEMKIEPFLLTSTLNAVIAQRLVRRICHNCRFSYKEKRRNIKNILPQVNQYFSNETITLYKGKGCSACGQRGYKGRIGIFEVIEITPEIQDLILKNPSGKEIRELAYRQGTISLFEDGISKVKLGIITLNELLSVAIPPAQTTQDIIPHKISVV